MRLRRLVLPSLLAWGVGPRWKGDQKMERIAFFLVLLCMAPRLLAADADDKVGSGPPKGEAPPGDGKPWPGSETPLSQAVGNATLVVRAKVADKAEITKRRRSTYTAGRDGGVSGGGMAELAACRQTFHIAEVLAGDTKAKDLTLTYEVAERSEGFPKLWEEEQPIPEGAAVIILLNASGTLLKALPDTEANRKAVGDEIAASLKRKPEHQRPKGPSETGAGGQPKANGAPEAVEARAAKQVGFKQVKIESLPKGWGFAHRAITPDGKVRGGHLSGSPEAVRVFESEEQCKASDMEAIRSLIAKVRESARAEQSPQDGQPPRLDRDNHGYLRVSITYEDGETLSFVVEGTEKFRDANVEATKEILSKYRAGAW